MLRLILNIHHGGILVLQAQCLGLNGVKHVSNHQRQEVSVNDQAVPQVRFCPLHSILENFYTCNTK